MSEGGEQVTEFCRRIHPRLVGALTLQVGDAELAQEIAQEALARAWERWRAVSTMAHPDAWVFRVALNLLNSHFRRRGAERRARARTPNVLPASQVDAAEAIAVRHAVAQLPPRERTAVVLRYFADLSVESTASAMGCRPGTVGSLTHHAMGRLRLALGDDHPFREAEELVHDA